jgi:NAD(P)-dependent dehydrogenase (short-subunit alcohol dehydrogenase family)
MAVVLITGTSTGIGLATAVAFGRAGYDVYATMRNPYRAPELASVAAKERLPIKILPMDVDNDASVGKAIAGVIGVPPENTRDFKVGSFTERIRTDESESLQRGTDHRGIA